MVRKIKCYLFYPRFCLGRFQFNLVTLFFLTIGITYGLYFALSRAIPYVFALNDTTKTWTFSSSTTGDYTKNQIDGETVMAVDDTGAHPTGGVVGANEFANPGFDAGSEGGDADSWSVAAVPPSGWVEVPGNAFFGTTNFLVMKYEAKCADTSDPTIGLTSPDTGDNTYADNTTACTSTNGRQVVSVASGFPIANISHTNALTRCSTVSLNGNATHLMRNDEWMTIARNAEAQAGNWSLGSVGSGYLFAGHNDNSPGKARVASTTDTGNNRCAYTDGDPGTEAPASCPTNTASGQSGTGGNQVRTFTLSNGAVIWDIAGNVWEHVQRSTNNAGDDTTVMNPLPDCTDNAAAWGWCQYGSTTTPYVSSWTSSVARDYVGPSNTSYNSAQGVGQVYTYKNGTSQSTTVFLRGASWTGTSSAGAFALYLSWTADYTGNRVGFRCASDPVAISQSFSSSSGRAGGGNTIIIGSISDGKIYQSVNVGDTSTYDFSVYVYDNTAGNVGGTVTSSVAQLYYNGSTIATTYTDAGSGWWKLSGTLTGANESREYGLLVKAGKTVKVDDFTLSKQGTYSVYTTSAYSNSKVSSWDSFSASETTSGNAAIYYQICLDDGSSCSYTSGSRWKYYTAGAWTDASDATTAYANTAAQLTQAAMQALPTSSQKISVKAIMDFGGADVPYLTSLQIGLTTNVTPPSISLTALSPDPNSDSTPPTISGTATEDVGTISSVSFQVDSTSGSWSSCSASDGSFDEAIEGFTCNVNSVLSDGSHTIYVRATDSYDNTTASGSEATDTFTIDTTAPVLIDLDAPGDNSYTSSERPTFKWKATSDATGGLSKYVLEIDNPSLGTGQPSGDFNIDNIPVSRTDDYETNKYLIHYENFSDSDSTNNYISIYTKSSTEWSTDSNSGQNDGKLREGRVSWTVKAVDNVGNETSSSRTLFVDRTGPKIEINQVNEVPFSSSSFSTTDKTPTIYGKITDPLAGGSPSQTQDENGPKIASGPKQVEIKIEKKEGLTYKLHTLYTLNFDKSWYSCDNKEISDNSKQKCDKYLPFEFTPEQNLDLGRYKITLTGKDKADNLSSQASFTLDITTLAQVTVPEEKETIEEETKLLRPEEREDVGKELEITKPTEAPESTVFENAAEKIVEALANLWWGLVDTGKTAIGVLADAWRGYQAFVVGSNQKILAILGKTTRTLLAAIGQGVAGATKSLGEGYNWLSANTPGAVKPVFKVIENGASAVTATAQNAANGVKTAGKIITDKANSVGEKMTQTTRAVSQGGIKLAQKVTTFVAITSEYWFDREPTKILAVKVEKVTPTSAVIYWRTNHHATSVINYGFDTSYGKKVQSSERVKEHRLELTDLEPGKTYFFEVMSQNKNYVYDAYYTFTTPLK